MDKGSYRFRLGDFECVALLDGSMDYEPKQFFSNADAADIERILREHNLRTDLIVTPYTYLYIDTGTRHVLVDMGAGDLGDDTGRLAPNMRDTGIDPAAIDTILITHAHPDHIGGCIDNQGHLVYPNAHYYIWKAEWEFWFSDAALSMVREWMVKHARVHLAPLEDRVTLLEQGRQVVPGISVLAAPGHTPGHMVVSVSSRGAQLMYIGDTVLSPLNLEYPDWTPVFDILPELAAESKARIFDVAASSHSWVLGQHFPPFPSLGLVVKQDKGWKWSPLEQVASHRNAG